MDPIKILQKVLYYIFHSNFEAIHFIHKSLVLLREIDQNIAFDCKGDEVVLQTLIFEKLKKLCQRRGQEGSGNDG